MSNLSHSLHGVHYQPNAFSSTAQELQTLAERTEEAKLYHEAVQLVLSKSENKDVGPQEKDLIVTHRTLEELMDSLNEKRRQSRAFGSKQSGMLWGPSKVVVDTLRRFEKVITSMAQASWWPPFNIDQILTEPQKLRLPC
jgi:hypothetical protein